MTANKSGCRISRRRALALGIGGTLTAEFLSRGSGAERPPGANGKFDAEGRFLRWPGNTILCFARMQPDLWPALVHVQGAARAEPAMRAFTLLPAADLHMTLLAGLDAAHRRAPDWPAALDTGTAMPDATAWCRRRLTDFATGGRRFRMRIDDTVRDGPVKAFAVRLAPADAAVADHLRNVRARLCARLEIDPPDRDAYAFHITLGYLIRRLTVEANAEVARLTGAWLARLAATVPEFTIGPPILCSFEDMSSFKPVLTLAD